MEVVENEGVEAEETTIQDEVAEQPEVEEEVVTFGESETPADEASQETPVIRKIRQADREKAKRIRELEQKLAQQNQQAAPQVNEPTVLPKKTLAEFDFDEDAYDQYNDQRIESISAHKRFVEEKQKRIEAEKQTIAQIQQRYIEGKSQLKVAPEKVQEAEDTVVAVFDLERQNMLLKSKNSARLVLALANDDDQLERLSKITDRDDFNRELGILEGKLSSKPAKRVAPEPEKMVTSSGGGFSAKTLDELREEAARTGDMSKVMAYKRRHKQS